MKGRGVEVTDAIRSYAEKRLGKLERQLPDPEIELQLSSSGITDAGAEGKTEEQFSHGPER